MRLLEKKLKKKDKRLDDYMTKIFDLILPIRTIGEIIHYAYRLASKLSVFYRR